MALPFPAPSERSRKPGVAMKQPRSSTTREVSRGLQVRARLRSGCWATLGLALTSACATVPPGYSAVVTGPSGVWTSPVNEGVSFIGPWSQSDLFDLRAQERNEDLRGIAADGAPVQANASVVTWHLVPEELVAFDREVGPHPYSRIIRPIVQAAVRRVVARYPAFQLMDTRNLPAIQKQITELAAPDVRRMHIQLDQVYMRSLTVASAELNAAIVETSRLEQQVLAMQHEIEIARRQADVRREEARALATANLELEHSLTPAVIADSAERAWSHLLASPRTSVLMPQELKSIVEVTP